MQLQIVLLLLCRFLLIEGRDDFEERKEFHEWLCRKRPSLSSCSKSFTKLFYEKEVTDHGERGTPLLEKTAARAFAARTDLRRDSPWNDADEDEEYEYYLWKKYRRAKLRRRLLENSFHSTPSIHHHYHHSDQSYPYYSRPSYGYRYPSYGYPSSGYGGGYGYGYPSYGGYGGYGGGYGGGLFSMGITRGLGISTPIGGFGIGSSFGIGIG